MVGTEYERYGVAVGIPIRNKKPRIPKSRPYLTTKQKNLTENWYPLLWKILITKYEKCNQSMNQNHHW